MLTVTIVNEKQNRMSFLDTKNICEDNTCLPASLPLVEFIQILIAFNHRPLSAVYR